MTLAQGVVDVLCQYCGHVIHVEWNRPVPRPEHTRALTVYVPPASAARVPIFFVAGAAAVMAVGGIAFSLLLFRGASDANNDVVGGALENVKRGLASAPSFPVHCGLNGSVEIVGQTFSGEGTLIEGEVNCKIRIRDSKLKGDVVVDAKNLVEVTVENSTLEGKQAAIQSRMNSKIRLTKQSQLRAQEAAILAGLNTEISLRDSQISGDEQGIKAEHNVRIEAFSSKISGNETGILGSLNAKISGRDVEVSGGRSGIEAQHNLELSLEGGKVEGKEAGVRCKGSNAELKLTRKARIASPEVAVSGDNNLHLEMRDAQIDGGEIGVQASSNPKLALLAGARVHGGRVAIKAGLNLELEMREATLASEGVALCAPFNIEVSARTSTISGRDAFRFERPSDKLELEGTSVTGARVFNAKSCNP
ncbi:MAG TPA: hypothetical protein VFQ61_35550 [Polyangiaceae bacterium]|nr:hypothetical protein [Polyangiaceae bacterium]